ncbi:hypothetical protein [Agromyces sp. SYSU T00266]|uniref:hypothetical protein n=1 Tax=Agromyces zhanjiangensis TaxID=3158562 RepID=UPI003391BA32
MSTHPPATRTRRTRISTFVVLGVVILAAVLALAQWLVTGDLTAVFEGIENGLTGRQSRRF